MLVGILDVISMWIVMPTLPDLIGFYHVSEHMISYWITSYAFFAFLATPLIGQLSDIFWRKKILLWCVIWSFISSLVIPIFPYYSVFILSRAINWITWWNISILQSIISDISVSKEERMSNMWLIWMIFAWWFIFWPLAWAMLLPYWVMVPYWFMVVITFIEIIAIITLFKETNVHMKKKKIKFNLFKQIHKYYKIPWLNHFMISFFMLITSFFIYQWVLPLYLSKEYGVSGSFSWYLMAISWLALAVNQWLLLNMFWLKRFSPDMLLKIINYWIFIWFILLTFIKPLYFAVTLIVILLPLRSLVNPVYQSEIIEYSELHARWEIMWVLTSLQSLWMFLWPLIWWYLIEKDISIFMFAGFFVLASIAFMQKILQHKSFSKD